MARIVITTWGSAGDLNPFLALAHGLRARGHVVRFAVEAAFRADIEAEGFPTVLLSGDDEMTFRPYQRTLFNSPTPFASIRIIYTKYVLPTLRGRVRELREACRNADLLVAAGQQLAASFVAELDGIPWVSVVLSPVSVPSASLRTLLLPSFVPDRVQQRLNDAAWIIALAWMHRTFDGDLNAVRREHGLPPGRDLVTSGGLSRICTAVAVSPSFVPPPKDWPAWVHETGFCFHDGADAWDEPPAIAAFFADGAPVVAVSSGSMGPWVPTQFDRYFHTALAAIHRAGAKALVIGAAAGSLPDPLPDGVLAVEFAPFSRIYPRCAAVMHHGGIGTTAQSLQAGVPTFVLPWGADQFFSAVQVERSGAGRWMTRDVFTVQRGARTLTALLHDPRYRARARAIAAHIATEDGVGALCDAIEKQLPAQQLATTM